MRAAFDRRVDFYTGPDTFAPGTLIAGNVPARLVPDWPFTDLRVPLSYGQYYLTFELVGIAGPPAINTTLQLWRYDFGQGETVALTTGGPVTHQVVRVEFRNWWTGASYYRAHIAPLMDELPSDCSLEYAESYDVYEGVAFLFTMARVGPTTWVYNEYTLEAEVGTLDPDSCFSTWHLTGNEPGFWVAGYTGLGAQAFGQSMGGSSRTIFPTP